MTDTDTDTNINEQKLDNISRDLINMVADLEGIDAVMIMIHTAFTMFVTYNLFNNRTDPERMERDITGLFREFVKANPIPTARTKQ